MVEGVVSGTFYSRLGNFFFEATLGLPHLLANIKSTNHSHYDYIILPTTFNNDVQSSMIKKMEQQHMNVTKEEKRGNIPASIIKRTVLYILYKLKIRMI